MSDNTESRELTKLEQRLLRARREETEAAPQVIVDDRHESGGNDAPEAAMIQALAELKTPDHLWDAPHLSHIKQAAQAVGVKREGLFALAGNRAALLAGPAVLGCFSEKGAFHLGSVNALIGLSGAGSNVTRRAAERLLPTPECLKQPHPKTFSSQEEADAHDWGLASIVPTTGSSLISHMQRKAKVCMETGSSGIEDQTFFLPRIHLSYTEGAMLLSSMKKSGSAFSQAVSLEPLILDAFVGDTLKADVADIGLREQVPAGSYTMAVDGYFQAEIIGEALAHTTGLAQRLRLVPILMPRGDERIIDAGRKLAYGGSLTDEELEEALRLVPTRPEHPGEMSGVVGFLTRTPAHHLSKPRMMTMCKQMRLELKLITVGLENGLGQDDPLVTHIGMNLYRLASSSALLRCSYEINELDWEISKAFAAVSKQTQKLMLDWAKGHARKEENEDNAKAVRRTQVIDGARALERGETPPIVKIVAKKFRDKLRKSGPLAAFRLRDSLNPNDVAVWEQCGGPGGKKGLRDAALVHGVASGLFRLDGRQYTL